MDEDSSPSGGDQLPREYSDSDDDDVMQSELPSDPERPIPPSDMNIAGEDLRHHNQSTNLIIQKSNARKRKIEMLQATVRQLDLENEELHSENNALRQALLNLTECTRNEMAQQQIGPGFADSDIEEDEEEDLSQRRVSVPVKTTSKPNSNKRTISEIGDDDEDQEEEGEDHPDENGNQADAYDDNSQVEEDLEEDFEENPTQRRTSVPVKTALKSNGKKRGSSREAYPSGYLDGTDADQTAKLWAAVRSGTSREPERPQASGTIRTHKALAGAQSPSPAASEPPMDDVYDDTEGSNHDPDVPSLNQEEEDPDHPDESLDEYCPETWRVVVKTSTGFMLHSSKSSVIPPKFLTLAQEVWFPALAEYMDIRVEKERKRKTPKDLDGDWRIHAKRTNGCIVQFLKEARTTYALKHKDFIICRTCFRNGIPCLRYRADLGFYVCTLPAAVRGPVGTSDAWMYPSGLKDKVLEKEHGIMWE